MYQWRDCVAALQLADDELKLTNQALLLAFNFFDRYMSLIKVRRSQVSSTSLVRTVLATNAHDTWWMHQWFCSAPSF